MSKPVIENFMLDPVTLEPMIITIGNVRPKGAIFSGCPFSSAHGYETFSKAG